MVRLRFCRKSSDEVRPFIALPACVIQEYLVFGVEGNFFDEKMICSCESDVPTVGDEASEEARCCV